jgi:hypothetical protein
VIGVHLHHAVVIAVEPPAKPVEVRAAQAELPRAMHHEDLRIGSAKLFGELARAVG